MTKTNCANFKECKGVINSHLIMKLLLSLQGRTHTSLRMNDRQHNVLILIITYGQHFLLLTFVHRRIYVEGYHPLLADRTSFINNITVIYLSDSMSQTLIVFKQGTVN